MNCEKKYLYNGVEYIKIGSTWYYEDGTELTNVTLITELNMKVKVTDEVPIGSDIISTENTSTISLSGTGVDRNKLEADVIFSQESGNIIIDNSGIFSTLRLRTNPSNQLSIIIEYMSAPNTWTELASLMYPPVVQNIQVMGGQLMVMYTDGNQQTFPLT